MQQRRRGPPGRNSGGRSRIATKRGVFWDDTLINKVLAPGNNTQDSLDQGVPEDEKKGMTLTRLLVNITITQVTSGTGGVYAAGIYLAEEDAFAAVAIPEPEVVGDDAGWVWRVLQVPVFASTTTDFAQARRFELDIRAQRKYIGEDYTMVLTQTLNAGAASSINLNGFVRALYKRA